MKGQTLIVRATVGTQLEGCVIGETGLAAMKMSFNIAMNVDTVYAVVEPKRTSSAKLRVIVVLRFRALSLCI